MEAIYGRLGGAVRLEYHVPKTSLHRRAAMVITLGPDLEAALNELARRQGVAPEVLALNALRERFLVSAALVQPRDEWERRLLGALSQAAVARLA